MPTTIFPFDVPNNYIYDSDKIEVIGGSAILKDLRPANATFYANFNSGTDATWGDGSLSASENGGISVSGGELIVDDAAKYLDFDADLNADSEQIGCVRMRITPLYSGTPSDDVYFLSISKANFSPNNLITLYHQDNGNIVVTFKDSTGSSFVFMSSAWSPVSGTQYELELNWNVNSGRVCLYIDGLEQDKVQDGNGTRDGQISLFRIGQDITHSSTANNFKVNDILYFSVVQHNNNYTPDWSDIPETPYVVDNPSITVGILFTHDDVESFVEESVKTGDDEIKYIIESDNIKYWHDGISWTLSDGTYTESNTAAEIQMYASSIATHRAQSRFFALLHSNDGLTTPNLDTLTVSYNFAATDEDTINKSQVWFFSRNINGEVNQTNITFRLEEKLIKYKDTIIVRDENITIVPDVTGYCEVSLIETDNMTTIDGAIVQYEVEIDNRKFYFSVPDEGSAHLFDLITT